MPDLKVVTVKGSTIERVMSVIQLLSKIMNRFSHINQPICKIAPNGSIYKVVADQWRADPSLLCPAREKCVDEVRKGNRVYPEVGEVFCFDYPLILICLYSNCRQVMIILFLEFADFDDFDERRLQCD